MERTQVINSLIQKIGAKRYLEIGVSDGENISRVKCDYKLGVDPSIESKSDIKLTSDEFFERNQETFDVIFVDGLHHADQVYRDIINSLNVLNDGGYIVCHDMNPSCEDQQIIPYRGGIWTGDCWKAFVTLRRTRSDLEMYTVDTDCGCGVIQKGKQDLLLGNEELTWDNFEKNRKKWLNLISVENFLQKVCLGNNNMDENLFNELIVKYIYDPENAESNFSLAYLYDRIGQTASALSYYLRTAERTDDDLLKYESLIRGALCFDRQGTRNFTVKGLLQHAIAVIPTRPEAYYLLSRHYSREQKDGSWNDSFLIASIGEKVCDPNPPELMTEVDCPSYGILFQKALSSWWCGLCEESRDLFLNLLENYDLSDEFKKIATERLKSMNVDVKPFSNYDRSKYDKLGIKFEGSENIEENYSEAYQDMFVLTMLKGKKEGSYLEIGAGNSFYGNNTALLEKDFNWKGVALDIAEMFVNAYNNDRKNPCFLKDASKINYENFLNGLGFSNEIDYLQLDCDPPEVTYNILLTIPFETHKFAVITYEHDYYCDETKSFQEKSRRYLESYGYVRVVNNISPDENRSYEDWWVHPDLVDSDVLNSMLLIDETVKKAENYILSPKEFIQKEEKKSVDWKLLEKPKSSTEENSINSITEKLDLLVSSRSEKKEQLSNSQSGIISYVP